MSVFDLATRLGYVLHALLAEKAMLGEWGGFVVTALVAGWEQGIVGGDDVVFEFAHCVEFKAGGGFEFLRGFSQGLLRGGSEGSTLRIEEGGEHCQRGDFGKGVDEGSGVSRNDVKVGACSVNKWEEGGTVHSFPVGEDLLEVLEGVDGEVEGFQAGVGSGVHEVDHPYVVVFHEADDVSAPEF